MRFKNGIRVYNCFYGSGISLRNAGVLRRNRIWNCAYACIAYHTQTDATDTSRTLVIEDNDCRQDYALDLPQRHIGNPAGPINPYVQGTIFLGLDACYPGWNPIVDAGSRLFVGDIRVRRNRSFLYRDYPSAIGPRAIPHLKINGLGPDHSLDIADNTFTDERSMPRFCDPASSETGNTCSAPRV